MNKTIYDLQLHESMEVARTENSVTSCMRVPGGWIYTEDILFNIEDKFNPIFKQVYVPYSTEFKDKKKTVKWSDPSIH